VFDAGHLNSLQGFRAMSSPHQSVLCRYRYDPLDQLTSAAPMGQAEVLRFYQKSRLANEIQGVLQRTIFQHEDQLLAQQQRQSGVSDTALLVTDQQRSVLHVINGMDRQQLVYSPYGHHPAESGLTSLLGFNGERRDPVTGHYMLGNGYRAFNPVLMRFNSPDSLSPFGGGGLNAYAYCQGDPVNFEDPTGHAPFAVLKKLGLARLPKRLTRPVYSVTSSANVIATPNAVRPSMIHHAARNSSSGPQILKSSAGSSAGPIHEEGRGEYVALREAKIQDHTQRVTNYERALADYKGQNEIQFLDPEVPILNRSQQLSDEPYKMLISLRREQLYLSALKSPVGGAYVQDHKALLAEAKLLRQDYLRRNRQYSRIRTITLD
jgi:RHS repeat-associated protein